MCMCICVCMPIDPPRASGRLVQLLLDRLSTVVFGHANSAPHGESWPSDSSPSDSPLQDTTLRSTRPHHTTLRSTAVRSPSSSALAWMTGGWVSVYVCVCGRGVGRRALVRGGGCGVCVRALVSIRRAATPTPTTMATGLRSRLTATRSSLVSCVRKFPRSRAGITRPSCSGPRQVTDRPVVREHTNGSFNIPQTRHSHPHKCPRETSATGADDGRAVTDVTALMRRCWMLRRAPPRTPGCCMRESQMVVATRGKRTGQRGRLLRFDRGKGRWEVHWLDLDAKSFILEKNLRFQHEESAAEPMTGVVDVATPTNEMASSS